ncbi:hypothetical protein NQD34_010572 [Periophthalmus magnuspinnatus]|nr:hypothetical protein NQD34_010572 [Periophthalmus magnuspinnatus]
MQDVAQVNQCGSGHKDDLHDPEADVRDGESFVVADILTTGLFGVTGESRLLIAPHLLCCCAQNHDPEDKQHRQPHFPHHSGVLLGTLEQLPQGVPVRHTASNNHTSLLGKPEQASVETQTIKR